MSPPRDDFDLDASAGGGQPRLTPGLLQVVWQRKAFVALGALVGSVIGALYYAQLSPVYQSGCQVLVIKKRSDALPIAGGDPRLSYVDDFVATHLVLIRSPLIIERAVKKRELQTLKSFTGFGDPSGIIMASLSATRDKEASSTPNNIINLAYRGSVSADCGAVLSAIIDSYKDFLDETYRNVSDDTLQLITRGRDVLQKDLLAKETAYRDFRQNSPLLWKGKDGMSVQQERVTSIETERSALLRREVKAQERLKEIETALQQKKSRADLLALLPAPPSDSKDQGGKLADDQLRTLLLQEEDLLQDLGRDHPQVQSVRRRINLARELLQRQAAAGTRTAEAENIEPLDPVQRYVWTLRKELHTAQLEQQSLAQLLAREQQEARRLSTYEIEDDGHRSGIIRTQQLYEGIIKRLQEINLVRDAGGFDAQPISRPGPGGQIAPKAMQTLMAGLLLGLLLGVGLAYLAEWSDNSFRSPEEIRQRLGMPVLGHIPVLVPNLDARRLAEAGQSVLDPCLCAHYAPKSVDAEAYRAVRTSLYFSTQGSGHTVVQLTSPDTGDGKSTLSTNLAVSIAQSGKRIILIDADLRRPRLHRMMGLPDNQAGLGSVMAGEMPWREAVRQTLIPGLTVLPSGPLPPNPAELLTSPRFQELLQEVRGQFDFVLVDTPPLLAVTDPCVVAPRVDGVILTVRLSKKNRQQAERAREILVALGVKVLGVVVNGVSRRAGAGGYGAENYEYVADDTPYERGDSQRDAAVPSSDVMSEGLARTERLRGAKRGGLLSWLLAGWF